MHVTLLLPGALLPREVVRALAEPLAASALASLLARAQLAGDSEAEAPPHLAWLAEHLFQGEAPLATAPYAVAALAGHAPAPDQFLWHADPVHLELARDHVALVPLAAPPSEDDAGALVAAANALAAEAGAEFVRIGDRWFLRTARAWELSAKPLAATFDQPLHAVLPAGRDAAVWNRLLTEIQMTWHAHPVNEAREARGEATVNSVWLHGGGRWAPLQRPAFAAVLADEPEWRGAAQAAGIASSSGQRDAGRQRAGRVVRPPRPAPAAGLDGLDRRAACPRPAPRAARPFGHARPRPHRRGDPASAAGPAVRPIEVLARRVPRRGTRRMTRLLVRDFDPAAAQRLVADGVLPALARVLAARGIARPDDLQLLIDRLVPPTALSHVNDAAILLADAIEAEARLLIVADYDCDGATACAVGLRGLRAMGARRRLPRAEPLRVRLRADAGDRRARRADRRPT